MSYYPIDPLLYPPNIRKIFDFKPLTTPKNVKFKRNRYQGKAISRHWISLFGDEL